jgi:4-amino-4-deoxy-L-arabinose transferase-like glycosyltransferase
VGAVLAIVRPRQRALREAGFEADQRQATARPAAKPDDVETRIETHAEYLLADELQEAPVVHPVARWEIVALLALTIVALLARIVALESIPPNFGGDEGEMGMVARSVLRGEIRDPFVTAWLSHPTLWFFTQALSLWVFGETIFGLRMLSVLIGTATVPALYVFARPLYGRTIALAAAALLTAYHFHIHFSRLGVNNIADPLLALVAFAAFFHGYRTRSPFSFALAGVTLGIAQHLYMGSRLAPLLLLAVLLHQFLLDRERLISLRWHLALLALGFLVGFGPLLRFFLLHPSDFTARMAMVGIFQTGWFEQQLAQGASAAQILLEQVRASFGAFTYLPDRSAWYDPHIPMLDRASAVLFVLGLAIAIKNWRRPGAFLLLAWVVGVGVFGGILLVNSPESPRYVTVVPALCLLIMLALDRLGAVVRWALPVGPRTAYGLVAAALLLLGLWNINFYFREYTPRRTYGWLNTEVATEIGTYLRGQPDPDRVYVYFFGPPRMFIGNGSIRFMAPEVSGVDVMQPISSSDQLPLLPDRRPIFIFLPERGGELEVVKSQYPNGVLRQFDAVSEQTTLFLSYEPR